MIPNKQNQTSLRRIEYCVATHSLETRPPLTNLDVDFEKGSLCLNGEGIKIKASIFKGYGLDLDNPTDQALVFSLEGILEDGKTMNTCSGLLLLKYIPAMNRRSGTEWRLVIHLYDDFIGDREIKFNLWMLPLSENALLN